MSPPLQRIAVCEHPGTVDCSDEMAVLVVVAGVLDVVVEAGVEEVKERDGVVTALCDVVAEEDET